MKPAMMKFGAAAAVVAAVGASACDTTPPYEEPPGWADELALPRPVDLNPDPHVLEIRLVAEEADVEIKKGKPTHVFTYGGSVPGPMLELTAGDRLVVHFENHLPEATTVHWHGVRLPVEMDGSPHHSQEPVPPGASFDYDFVVPDAGLFWYHPHLSSSKQLGFGSYGALVVRPADDSERALPKDELVLVLSDIGIEDDGTIVDPASGGDLGALFGREGNFILANGRRLPTLHARSGVTQRWRVVNAARSRYFQLEMSSSKFDLIGVDGGLLEHPVRMNQLLLAPGQRADVLVTPVDDGAGLDFVRWIPYDRGFGSVEFRIPDEVFAIDFLAEEAVLAPLPTPDVGRDIEPLDLAGALVVPMKLTQTKDEEGHLEMGINDVPFDEAPPFPAKIGQTQIWELENTIQWAHPFHLHGFFFQEIDDAGAPVEPIAWRDTIDVPVFARRRIAVKFDERPGHWMFHCHVLDHADAGMMGMVDLVP